MIDPASFKDAKLRGGFIIQQVELTSAPMVDALDREAIAKTSIVGHRFQILIRAELTHEEISISLYHEILEAATVASLHPPERVVDFNEGDFERQAIKMHAELGEASVENLNRMLQFFGF